MCRDFTQPVQRWPRSPQTSAEHGNPHSASLCRACFRTPLFRSLTCVHSHDGLHVRHVPCRTACIRGFCRFISSTPAPASTGRHENDWTGIAPARKQRLATLHEISKLKRTLQNYSKTRSRHGLMHLLYPFSLASTKTNLPIPLLHNQKIPIHRHSIKVHSVSLMHKRFMLPPEHGCFLYIFITL